MPKPHKAGKPKIGRPRITLDWDKIDVLLVSGSTGVQVAAHLGVHEDTLYHGVEKKYGKSFSDYTAQKRQKGISMLAYKQFSRAYHDGSDTMLIWLGKQKMGQRDKDKEQHKDGEAIDLKEIRALLREVQKIKEENVELKKKLDELELKNKE